MRDTLNRFALCANFTLLRKGPITHSVSGGPGSAHCRKICSLKRHVPFDALYIIHKVGAITVPRARARALAPSDSKENAERFDFSTRL